METLKYQPVNSFVRGTSMFLSFFMLMAGVFQFTQGKIGEGVLALVLSLFFLLLLTAQGIITHLSETIRSTKTVLDYLDSKGLLPPNKGAALLLYKIDKESVKRRNRLLTKNIWVKRSDWPASKLVEKVLESYHQKTLPKMPLKTLTLEEQSLIDEVAVMSEAELERDFKTEGFNEVAEGRGINLRKV